MPIIVSDRGELRVCVMHLWHSFNGLGLNLKNSKNQGQMPHIIKDVDVGSPAQYAGVLNNDLIIKIGNRVVEYEKFDTVLKLIKEQIRKEKKCQLLVVNLSHYAEFKSQNETNKSFIDYNSPALTAQIKYYESPLTNPNDNQPAAQYVQQSDQMESPEARLCHLLTWSSYDGYGFYVAYNQDGCYVKTVEPNSPAQTGGLRTYDRIVEINGKSVNAKDRDFVMKQINKHKKSQHVLTSTSSKSAYSVATNKSNYLNILTCDPATFKWLTERRIDISSKNKSLKLQECYTPAEPVLVEQETKTAASSSSKGHQLDYEFDTRSSHSGGDMSNTICVKLCTIRRLKDNEPLGFEMTKRGTQAHYLSRIEPGTSAALSGLALNDYLIELNHKNVEQDENSLLREKIFDSLDKTGEFSLLTINKEGYNHCVDNKISTSGFIQINNHKIQRFETPGTCSPFKTEESVNTKPIPRLCVLRKTVETSELGLSIARMKNVSEHVINDVVPGSLADLAGIRVNDALLEVNGENVENKSHVETVNRIIELARQPNANISLLVVERPPKTTQKPQELKQAVANQLPDQDYKTNEFIYSSISKAGVPDMPSMNAYPEIKVCEFIGYPGGSQLGLVVTSDEYSHDIVRVIEESPAAKAGLLKGDVIICVNGHNVEGSPTGIELLNDFDEAKPLRVLAASRYAYEWSKLLRVRIVERDWPNIKKCTTKHVSEVNYYEAENRLTRTPCNKIYYSTSQLDLPSPPTYSRNYLSPRSANTEQMSVLSTLSRSAVDITADGQVLRMCTLYLDPSSHNPADAEFGFDLVTKIGRAIGDYYIDTVDEDSPAYVSGIKPGDRLVEVDGIDVKNKTFEQVVQIISEAKLRSRLKLLVHPSVVINYGNPDISEQVHLSTLAIEPPPPQLPVDEELITREHYEFSKNLYKKTKSTTYVTTDYDTHIYKKKSTTNLNNNFSKSSSNIYSSVVAPAVNVTFLRPTPRLCTLFKDARTAHSSNIGFGIQTRNVSATLPNYMRVSIVNYKSPAYLSGLEAGDLICEINGRSTLEMSHDESLYFIKSSYEINSYVRLLVLSEFCYNWLAEHSLLASIKSDHSAVFSYADYLKHNQRLVPRLCKIKLYAHNNSFGFQLETMLVNPGSPVVSANKAATAAQTSYAHLIAKIERDSAGHAAGLLKGDRIIELDGINVEADNEKLIADRIFQAFASMRQMTVFVVDPDTDNYFKSKCVKLHSMLPIVQHITNHTDN